VAALALLGRRPACLVGDALGAAGNRIVGDAKKVSVVKQGPAAAGCSYSAALRAQLAAPATLRVNHRALGASFPLDWTQPGRGRHTASQSAS